MTGAVVLLKALAEDNQLQKSKQTYSGLAQCQFCTFSKQVTSVAISTKGRVVLTCRCGGKHYDGTPRQHSMWTLGGSAA